MTAEWRDVVGYEGYYQVSSRGDVRSVNRVLADGRRLRGRLRRKGEDTKGYYYVPLSRNGKVTNHRVHRMVAIAFIPNPFDKPEVNHKDGDPSNNHVSNLEWATPKEQGEHASRNGLLGRVTYLTHNGITQSLGKWAAAKGIKRMTLSARLQRGMSVNEALSMPTARFGGRLTKGKLNDDKVRGIRRMLEDGRRQVDIAKVYGITFQMVSQIKRGTAWGHVV